jgi:tRNA pseudouridine55 synthase
MSKTKAEVSGFIAIDKPAGISSFDVIRRLRKITQIRKIGHCGTLDPFATGLLVCCIGSYTRLAKYIESETKTYFATIQLGGKTDTGDTESEVSQTAEIPRIVTDTAMLKDQVLSLCELPVPAYSAIKLDGKRAYALARNGTKVDMPVRPTQISAFEIIPEAQSEPINALGQLSYRCTVSKGTYIRSLSEWIALQLGTLGYTMQLRREAIGNIDIMQAVTLESLTDENWQQYFLSPRYVLNRFTVLELDDAQAISVANGGDLTLHAEIEIKNSLCALYSPNNTLLAIGEALGNTIHPIIVLK